MGVVAIFTAVDQVECERLLKLQGTELDDALCDHSSSSDIDVDKAWDGLHFLFTGKSVSGPGLLGPILSLFGAKKPAAGPEGDPALALIFVGGERFKCPDSDVSFFDAATVTRINQALSSVTDDDLLARFDAERMAKAGVYLKEFWLRDRAVALDYLRENLTMLRGIFKDAAASGKAILRTMG